MLKTVSMLYMAQKKFLRRKTRYSDRCQCFPSLSNKQKAQHKTLNCFVTHDSESDSKLTKLKGSLFTDLSGTQTMVCGEKMLNEKQTPFLQATEHLLKGTWRHSSCEDVMEVSETRSSPLTSLTNGNALLLNLQRHLGKKQWDALNIPDGHV